MAVVERPTEEQEGVSGEVTQQEPVVQAEPQATPEPSPAPAASPSYNWEELEQHDEFKRRLQARSEPIIQSNLRPLQESNRQLQTRLAALEQQVQKERAERSDREWDTLDEDEKRDRAYQMVQNQRVRQRLSQELEPEIRQRVAPEATQQAFQAAAASWLARPEFQAETLTTSELLELERAASAGARDWYNKWSDLYQRRVIEGYVPAGDVERMANERAEARFRELQQQTAPDNEPETARPSGGSGSLTASQFFAMSGSERDTWIERASLAQKRALEDDMARSA